MSAITADIAHILQDEVSALTSEIASILFNEPFEADPLTDLFNKLRGTCVLLELEAAVVLVDELKKTVNFIVDKGNSPISCQPELAAILDVFPGLFNVFHQIDVSSPFLLTPELAVLRRIQGQPPLYEFQMVKNHSWPPADQFKGKTELGPDAAANLKKLKQLYQMGLLELLRGRDLEKGAEILVRVAGKLRLIFTSEAETRYWQLVELAARGVRDGKLTLNPVRLRLLAAVERQLKTLLDGGVAEAKAYPLGLWRAYGILLSLIPDKDAEAVALCRWVGAPEFAFTDAQISDARSVIFGDEDGGLDQLVTELGKLLGELHNILELVDSQGELNADEAEDFENHVEQIASRCRDNGLTRAAARFGDHQNYIRAASGDSWQPGSLLLKDTAHSILYLECLLLNLKEQGVALKGLISKLDLREVDDVVAEKLVATSIHAVWEECVKKLAAIKEIIDEVANDISGSEVTDTLLEELAEIEGAARIVGEPQVVAIVNRCRDFIANKLFAVDPETKKSLMVPFADTVVALEYFFQNFSTGEKSDFALNIADDYLANLEAAA